MTRVRIYALGMLLVFSGLSGCGSSGPPRIVPDLPDASAADKAMELYDTNRDGFLDAKELEKAPGLKAALKQKDGKISKEEIAERIKGWADSHFGRVRVPCRVTHNGIPLGGAKVTFVPETFLGGTLQPGSGTTSVTGDVNVSCASGADSPVPGLSLGFYRVEITKAGENIPAKYNTETTLGAEVTGGYEARNGLKFELEY